MPATTDNTDRTPTANPLAQDRLKDDTERARERLMAKVTIADTPHPRLSTPCWLFGGALNRGGYGQFHYSDDGVRVQLAHRASYIIHTGEIPSGQLVRHQCDNPACVNPDHLELGTQQQNMSDMASRGPATVRAKSGFRGVDQVPGGWLARVRSKGARYQKFFKLIEDAIAWVTEQRQRLHGALIGGYAAGSTLGNSN